MLPTLVKVLKI